MEDKTFKKYQHLERLGTTEVENINLGECHIFPKIDGTNGSVWLHNNIVKCGSRKRELSLFNDNAGFCKHIINNPNILNYLTDHPNHRLFGEWLVPHSLKTYKQDAWNIFYVFDVVEDEPSVDIEQREKFKYLTYDQYKPLLEQYNIAYIPLIGKVTNGNTQQFINQLKHNTFLIEDGKGIGEGIVIKNYDFKNKYGRITWAKLVTNEFKEKHQKETGGHEVKGKKLVEQEIAIKYTTKALCDKTLAKIKLEGDFSSKDIPRLLNTIYYEIIREETWNFLKDHKNPTISFNTLKALIFQQVKKLLPELF